MGACGFAPLSVLTTAFHNLFCSLNYTHLWPYVGLLPSLITTLLPLIAPRLCRDDANTMEVMLNAKVPGWGKERVKVSLDSTTLAADLLQMPFHRTKACPLRRCTPHTGSALRLDGTSRMSL